MYITRTKIKQHNLSECG